MSRFAIICLFVAGVSTAAHAQPPDIAQARAKELKANIKSFRLELIYHGDEDKPFYRLIVSVPPIGYDRSNPFYRLAQVTEEQAGKIIDHLAGEGFLTKAADLRNKQKRPPPTMPGYGLTVGDYYQDLGWGLPMLKRLDGLRKVLDGDAAKGMDFVLGRLSGLRQQWEKEPQPKPDEQTITQLIRQLSDDNFDVREKATKDLMAMGEAVHPTLKALLKRGDLDRESDSRIRIILGEKPIPLGQGGPSVTDPASGVTVSITSEGKELTAIKDGKTIWKIRFAQPVAQTLKIEGGLLVVLPENAAYDFATGKSLWKR